MEKIEKNPNAAGGENSAHTGEITSAPGRGPGDDSERVAAQVGNEDFEFQSLTFDDQRVTGAQIADAAGAHPLEQFTIMAQLANFELETLRPTEQTDLNKVARFFVIKGSGTDRFLVDGLNLEWPKKVITGLTIKRLVGKDDEEIELVQELEIEADRVIEDEDEVRIEATVLKSSRPGSLRST